MFDRFTDRARRAISYSKDEAERLGHDRIGSEHVLLGLLKEGSGVAAHMLSEAGIELDAVRRNVEMRSSPSTDTQSVGELPFSPAAKALLGHAIDEAQGLGQEYVGTEHILLGLLRDEKSEACSIIVSMGVKLAAIRKSLTDYMQGNTEDEPQKEGKEGKGAAHPEKKSKTPALDAFGRDITQLARDGKLDPVIGREKEISRMIHILARRQKNNPVLIGEAGVGKTAIVEGFAQMIVNGGAPEILSNKRLIELDLGLLVAGTKFRGQFEERLKAVVYEMSQNHEIMLYVDELHTMVGAGNAEGAMDASNLLKPALARGELQCIGATTLAEYRKYIEKDAALERRFQAVNVCEPTEEQAIDILKGLKKKYETFHKVKVSDAAIVEAVTLSARYVSSKFLPDKAIDIIDEGGAKIKLGNDFKPPFKELENLANKIDRVKERAVARHKYELAAEYRDRVQKIRAQLQRMKDALDKSSDEAVGTVDVETVREVVSNMTGIPLKSMSDSEVQKLLDMETDMRKKIVSQDEAIEKVCQAVRRSRAGLKDPARPIGSFMFLGPTGVGKTLLAKTLAHYLFGSDDAMIKIDMSEYMEKHTVARLIGAPPGYIGYDDAGQLTEKVRRKPYSVVLFDEIEKAHPDVCNVLLQVLEDGRLTDGQGRVVDFKNTIVIMTSNVGADMLRQSSVGFAKKGEQADFETIKRKLGEAVNENFRPEFINRLDDMIFFRPLGKEDLSRISEMEFEAIAKRAAKRKIVLVLTEPAKDVLIVAGFDPKFGARPMRRAMEKLVETELSIQIISGKIKDGDTIEVGAAEDGKTLTFVPLRPAPKAKAKSKKVLTMETVETV